MKTLAVLVASASLLAPLSVLAAGKEKPTAVAVASPASPTPSQAKAEGRSDLEESPMLPGEEGKPFAHRRVACQSIQLVAIQYGPVIANPASTVVVANEQGHSGLSIFVNRETGQMVAVTAWREVDGVRSQTTLPGVPRIDYQDCAPAVTEGGILIDYYDAKSTLPY